MAVVDLNGVEVAPTCENCDGLYDDSDGPEYGPPSYRCQLKPHMENLRGFPFKTPQKCFEPHWAIFVDWEAEARRDEKTHRPMPGCEGERQ